MSDTRILVVEDDKDVLDLVERTFVRAGGFAVSTASDGRVGYGKALREGPQLIILDLMLPKIPGLEVTKLLKVNSTTRHIPILMLTAKTDEVDRIVGFEMGASDYVTKPFSPRELLLRARSILQRTTHPSNGERLSAGPITLDIAKHSVMVDDLPVRLTTVEYKLLNRLMEVPRRAHARNRLLNDVWGYSRETDTRTIDTHVRRLRKKLGKHGNVIETVRGFGYKLREQE
jgi:two-component system, OmpR family, phosphate regulon response regulator PhoB